MAHALTTPAELSFRRYGADAPPHAHAFDQIVLPRRGVLEMEIDGKGGRVDPGRAAVVPPGARHAFAATGENLFVVADIGGDLMKRYERLRERPFAPVTGAVIVGTLGALGCWRLLTLNTATLLRKMV